MKKLIKFFILFLLVQTSFSQTLSEQDDNIYNSAGIEVKPEYPGGISAFYKFVANNFIAPIDKSFKGGKVIVAFVVERDGSLSDIKILRDAGFGTGVEAMRVFKLSEKWKPAVQNGKNVRVSFLIPITLQSN
jgi:protein TonB